MKKQGNRTLTPRLRFPEFRDKGEWEEEALGDICEILNNRRVPISSNDRTPGPYPYYGASGVVDSVDDYIFDERLVLIGEDGAKWKAFEETAFIAEGRYWVNNHAHVLKPLGVIDILLANYLTMIDVGGYVTGNAPPKLTLAKLKTIPVPVSRYIKEQQRIADCLSSLDNLIAAEGRKLAALREHKRGLMQRLFPREGETVPRLRFPEFRGKGEWEEERISELGEVITGSTPSTVRSEYYGGNRQFVSPADISELRFISETKTTLTELGFQQTRPVKAKSTLFVCIGSTIGKVAQNLKECATNQQINSVTASPGTSSDFLYYLLSECSERIAKIAGNQAVPIVKKSLFAEFKVLCPKKEEQQRIAACLSALDELISAQAKKVELLKQHKKGLMQQLFPSPEEVEV